MAREMDLQLDNFMLYCESKHLSEKTMRSYEQTLKLFLVYLESEHKITDLNKVKSAHVRSYIKYLRERGKYSVVSNQGSMKINYPDRRTDTGKKVSDTTIANYLRNIKVFFNFLYSEREIQTNPVEKIENIKPQRKKKKLLSKEDIQKVLSQFDTTTFHGYRSFIMVRLILDSGMRASEICSLLPEHLDFKSKSILIENPKNNQQRFVYFSHKMSLELKRWMQYRDRFSDSIYLFPTIRGTQLDIRNFEKTVRQAGQKVDVPIHIHQLRNSFAKYYLLAGGDFATLSRILGHSSMEVTMKAYLDFSDSEVGRKYQKHSPLNSLDI